MKGPSGKGVATQYDPIPFVDLKRQYAAICDEVQQAIQGVLDQCAFASGPAVAAFEAEFSRATVAFSTALASTPGPVPCTWRFSPAVLDQVTKSSPFR